jgi:hypothetical protein
MECEFCKNKFSNKQNLNNHQRTAKYCLKIQGVEPHYKHEKMSKECTCYDSDVDCDCEGDCACSEWARQSRETCPEHGGLSLLDFMDISVEPRDTPILNHMRN